MKPLFIPLKKEHYEAFERGEKTDEFRQYGPRWNERTCTVGRPVVLSCGYGKRRRLSGVITSFTKKPVWQSKGGATYLLVYGVYAIGPVAEIGIEIKKEVMESMTWGAKITNSDGLAGESGWSICSQCKHQSFCNVNKIGHVVGSLLTSIDVGSDGHMASGHAELRCNGFEAVETAPSGEQP